MTHLVPECIDAVVAFEEKHKYHGVRQPAQSDVLLASTRDVKEHPPENSRSVLNEGLDIPVCKSWDSGVERTANEVLKD